MTKSCPISVVIPTWQRKKQLSETLAKILVCYPCPAEILVHVDAGDNETTPWLMENFPTIRVLESKYRVGPGGGRNRLIAAAKYPIVASFDDDSYPLDTDYFERLVLCFEHYPEISVLASRIIEKNDPLVKPSALIGATTHFGGGGVSYRREDFLESQGYVPLAIAYGMEEVDLCLRFFDMGKRIYFSPWLRVFHNSELTHHSSAAVTAASIQNLALLIFLRYPKRYWFYGALQILNRVVWLAKVRRYAGIPKGIIQIPIYCWRYTYLRQPVSPVALKQFFRLRKSTNSVEPLANTLLEKHPQD